MTPAARLAAAAGVLDRVLAGEAAERALTSWARGARYAGSKDRAAVRDLAFDALRRRRSLAWVGGAETGRGLMLGRLRDAGEDPAGLMTGEGYALALLMPGEEGRPLADAPRAARLDVPDWLLPRLDASLGEGADAACLALRERAPVFLRANLRKASREEAVAAMTAAGIETKPHPDVRTAIEVTVNAGKIALSEPYLDGLVELQDASSQAAVLRLPLRDGDRVLDLCAGGGGKSLAMGALARLDLVAHDAAPARVADLLARAARAGLRVALASNPTEFAPYDLVLVDAPCSGSGTWRRAPDAKWRLTPERLSDLAALQARLMDKAAALVRPGGHLAFATCSVLDEEGRDQATAFVARSPGFAVNDRLRLLPGPGGDGFFQAVLRRA